MANLRINKLDEALLNKIKTSIKESDGNNWKKEWTCRSLPINGISGRPFTGKTELFLFLVNKDLVSKGNWTYGDIIYVATSDNSTAKINNGTYSSVVITGSMSPMSFVIN